MPNVAGDAIHVHATLDNSNKKGTIPASGFWSIEQN